jgi:prolipoprotein diacylglyceryltransferase
MVVFSVFHRRNEPSISFWKLGDVLLPGMALAITFGWAACLMGGCSYGAFGQGFGHMILPDLYGVEASRFATQIAGLAFALVLFISFWLLRGHWPFPGASFLMYVLLYFAGQFFLESTRGDEAIYLGPLRLAQILDLVIALAAAVGLIVLWQRARRGAIEQEGQAIEPELKGDEAVEVQESAAAVSVEAYGEPPAAEGPEESRESTGPAEPYGTS